jgi:hypothetical protein
MNETTQSAHEGFPSAESAKNHWTGWGMILDKLTTKVS